MFYFVDDEVKIRDMTPADAQTITDAEIAQGWDQTVEKYERRLRDQADGKAISLVAEYRGVVAGYINVYLSSEWGALGGQGLPEIIDLGVPEKYRHRGIGTKLMGCAEHIASEYADRIYLGVGLHSGYGSAQRLYVELGYVPDGSGVWYRNEVCPPYSPCCNDDDLVLYMVKEFRGKQRRENLKAQFERLFPDGMK